MTNKFTTEKRKKQSRKVDLKLASDFFVKNSRQFEIFLEGQCPSGNNTKKKSWYMENLSSKYENKKIKFDQYTDLETQLMFYSKGKSKYDVDNMVKTVLDAMEGNIYFNDNQIKKLTAQLHEDNYIEGVSIIVKPIN